MKQWGYLLHNVPRLMGSDRVTYIRHKHLLVGACLFFIGLSFGFSAGPSSGQMLYPGDIAIVGMNSDRSDSFSFVNLVDVPEGVLIWFTDNGWKVDGEFRQGEKVFLFVATQDIPQGSVTVISTSDGSPNFSTAGDQLFAYQLDDNGHPHFIYGLNNSGAATWQSTATDESTSTLPPDLQNGYSAVALNHCDNVVYTGVSNGRPGNVLQSIGDASHWTCSDNITLNLDLQFDISGQLNHSPIFVNTFRDTTVVAGSNFEYRFQAVDPDGDEIVYVGNFLPLGAFVQLTTGLLSWTPFSDQIGDHDFSIWVGDGSLATEKNVTISVIKATAVSAEFVVPSSSFGQVYPNPTSGTLTIPFDLHSPGHIRIEFTDVLGRDVFVMTDRYYGSGHHVAKVDVSHLSPGTYILQFPDGTGRPVFIR